MKTTFATLSLATLALAAPAFAGGACSNSADKEIWDSHLSSFDSEMQSCGMKCITKSDFEGCVSDCMVEKDGYSSDCGDCLGELSGCTKDHCKSACLDGASDACKSCVEKAGCNSKWSSCSGLDAPTEEFSVYLIDPEWVNDACDPCQQCSPCCDGGKMSTSGQCSPCSQCTQCASEVCGSFEQGWWLEADDDFTADNATEYANTTPNGKYTGSASAAGIKVTVSAGIKSSTKVDLKMTGDISISCSGEEYKYDGASTITLPNADKSGNCVHDALKKYGASIKSMKYDNSKDYVTASVKAPVVGTVTVKMTH